MRHNRLRHDYLVALALCCLGCLLLGSTVVYPIFAASSSLTIHGYGGRYYSEVTPYFGAVSESATEFVVTPVSDIYSDVIVEIRNFYTNNSSVTLILAAYTHNETVPNFYNQTTEPINHEFHAWHYDFSIVIQYDGYPADFSFWLLVTGTPPLPPPPPIFVRLPFDIILLVFGITLLILGLHRYRLEKLFIQTRSLRRALIFCSLGILFLSLSYPSLTRPLYFLHIRPPEYTDFGEFSGIVSQSVPRVNRTLIGVEDSTIELRTFFVNHSSVTVSAYTPDGSVNQTWNYVNSRYPGYQTFEFYTTNDTIIEIIRETDNVEFHSWILVRHIGTDILLNQAGFYAPYAFLFFGIGIILLISGWYYVSQGLRTLSKMTNNQ